ncbi:type II secretion system protein GspM [Marinicaulis aureus]|uniref:Type II secretion system protein GspM n=1 Tax=Hyphococcus aureus TaxID=2666033 RepID=A0ABW1KZF0_9PROT
MSWWHDLSARERLLILIAGGLAGLLFLSLGIMRPLADLRSDAARKASSARDGYELTAAAAAVAGGSDATAPQGAAPLRQAILETARGAGVELARIGSENNGQIEIQVAAVSGDVFFEWLALLQNRYGVSIAFADIARGEDGMVTPQVLVLER